MAGSGPFSAGSPGKLTISDAYTHAGERLTLADELKRHLESAGFSTHEILKMKSEQEKVRAMASSMGSGSGLVGNKAGTSARRQNIPDNFMVAMRMGWGGEFGLGQMLETPFAAFNVMCNPDGVRCVSLCTKDGKFVHIEDDAAMFPSDALINRLRLIV